MATLKAVDFVFKNKINLNTTGEVNIFVRFQVTKPQQLSTTYDSLVVELNKLYYVASTSRLRLLAYDGSQQKWSNDDYRYITFLNSVEITEYQDSWLKENQEKTGSETVSGKDVYDSDMSVSGVGNEETRENEITPDNVAIFRNFVIGYNSNTNDIGGVIHIKGHDFDIKNKPNAIPQDFNLRFKANITLPPLMNTAINVQFTSGDTQFNSLNVELGTMFYDNVMVYNPLTGWTKASYATIHLLEEWQLNERMEEWILENTNWQKKYVDYIELSDGMFFAYGYRAYCVGRKIIFFPPPVEQYQLIYAELDRSVIPNEATIEVKSNQSSSRILRNTFRQDQLSTIRTGKFQMPLWIVKLTNKGVESVTDIRPLRQYISRVVYSDNTKGVYGKIASNVEVMEDMKPLDTNDKSIATTKWAKSIIDQEIRR